MPNSSAAASSSSKVSSKSRMGLHKRQRQLRKKKAMSAEVSTPLDVDTPQPPNLPPPHPDPDSPEPGASTVTRRPSTSSTDRVKLWQDVSTTHDWLAGRLFPPNHTGGQPALARPLTVVKSDGWNVHQQKPTSSSPALSESWDDDFEQSELLEEYGLVTHPDVEEQIDAAYAIDYGQYTTHCSVQ